MMPHSFCPSILPITTFWWRELPQVLIFRGINPGSSFLPIKEARGMVSSRNSRRMEILYVPLIGELPVWMGSMVFNLINLDSPTWQELQPATGR